MRNGFLPLLAASVLGSGITAVVLLGTGMADRGTTRTIVEVIIRVVVLGVAFCLIWYGYINYLRGFGSFRLPSGTPIASLYAIIPISGVLIALFTIEQLVNGIRNGFDHPEPPQDDGAIPMVEGSKEGARP